MKPNNARAWPAPLLLALALSLTACAAPSPSLRDNPQLPPAPALSEPIPPESYSQTVQRLLQTWREKLTATPATP